MAQLPVTVSVAGPLETPLARPNHSEGPSTEGKVRHGGSPSSNHALTFLDNKLHTVNIGGAVYILSTAGSVPAPGQQTSGRVLYVVNKAPLNGTYTSLLGAPERDKVQNTTLDRRDINGCTNSDDLVTINAEQTLGDDAVKTEPVSSVQFVVPGREESLDRDTEYLTDYGPQGYGPDYGPEGYGPDFIAEETEVIAAEPDPETMGMISPLNADLQDKGFELTSTPGHHALLDASQTASRSAELATTEAAAMMSLPEVMVGREQTSQRYSPNPAFASEPVVTIEPGTSEDCSHGNIAVSESCNHGHLAVSESCNHGHLPVVHDHAHPLPLSDAYKIEVKRTKDREKKRQMRANPDYREKERERSVQRMRHRRQDPGYRDTERARDRARRRLSRRHCPEQRDREKARDRMSKRVHRMKLLQLPRLMAADLGVEFTTDGAQFTTDGAEFTTVGAQFTTDGAEFTTDGAGFTTEFATDGVVDADGMELGGEVVMATEDLGGEVVMATEDLVFKTDSVVTGIHGAGCGEGGYS